MKQILLSILFFLCLYSQVYTIKKGQVTIKARSVLVGIEDEFDAIGDGLKGQINLNDSTFHLVYDLWNLDTGISLRNEHMHSNYLETEDYPEVVFSGRILKMSDTTLVVTGDFSLHDVKRKLVIKAQRNGREITASWSLKLSDYNIEIPSKFLVAKLKEELAMSVKINLN